MHIYILFYYMKYVHIDRRTDRRTDRPTDRQTDGQTGNP